MAEKSRKKRILILPAVFVMLAVLLLSACEEVERPVQLSWGIPEGREMFEGAVMEPEGEEVQYPEAGVVELTWYKNESYVLPFSAFSEEEVPGVRYIGTGVPQNTGLEWKDPWEVEWYPFEALPEDKVKAEIEEENGLLNIDFGPPGGANFEEGMVRLAWFRITPVQEGEFEFAIHGYTDAGENQEGFPEQVTNEIKARVTVESP